MLAVTAIGIITLSFFYIYSLVHVLNINFFILIEKEKIKTEKEMKWNSHRYAISRLDLIRKDVMEMCTQLVLTTISLSLISATAYSAFC